MRVAVAKEIRIWRACPEIREPIGRAIKSRLIAYAIALPVLVVCIPFYLLAKVAYAVAMASNEIHKITGAPLVKLRQTKDKAIAEVFRTMTAEQIERRLENTETK